MTFKSVANCLYTIFLKEYIKILIYSWPNVVTFTISKVEWVEIIKILIISSSSLMTLTKLILAGLLCDLFYQNFDKIYQLVSCNQLNTSIIEPISMDSPPMISGLVY